MGLVLPQYSRLRYQEVITQQSCVVTVRFKSKSCAWFSSIQSLVHYNLLTLLILKEPET